MTEKLKILISAPYMLPVVERFIPLFEEYGIETVIPEVEERLEEDELLALIQGIDGVICGDDRFTEKVIKTADRLKVISKWGTGIDSIDQQACKKDGVRVCNTPNAFTVPVSDTVLAYILSFARNIPWMNEHMHNGHWEKIPGSALHENTLGVIGVGNIGTMVLEKASAFGMKLLASDTNPEAFNRVAHLEVTKVSNQTLMEESDFISINCDLNSTSEHLINSELLSHCKKQPVVINTARGPIINEQDLVTALQDGTIRGAALDVFEEEPLADDSPLLEMNKVLMAPHNSNSSPTAWEHVHKSTVNNLFDILLGIKPL